MPAQPSSTTGTALCQRCWDMFSNEGVKKLTQANHIGFVHSILETFSERPDCTLCSYVWNEELEGACDYGEHSVMGLRQLAGGQKDIDPTRDVVLFSLPPLGNTWPAPHGGSFYLFRTRIWSRARRKAENVTTKGLLVAASEGDPFAQYTTIRPIRNEGLTEDFATAVKALLAECEQSHHQCKPSGLGPFPPPTRLLRIIPQQQSSVPLVHLVLPPQDGPFVKYACLSYCWGGPQAVRLTKANVHVLQTTGLDVHTLPQTLKDAVLTTQCLGLQYLWVDALCIIQDDDEDKKHEIARMSSIYSNCTVCISAATAKSVEDGFVKPAHQINNKYPECRITLPLGHNDLFHGTMILTPKHEQNTYELPINKRGWTFQEAVLPTRTLTFGDLEPVFRCKTNDVVPVHESHIVYREYERVIAPLRLTAQTFEAYNLKNLAGHIEEFWPDVVDEYTRRRLAVVEDKQHAIQAFIDVLAGVVKERCYFGIWPSFPPSLAWTAYEHSGEEGDLDDEGEIKPIKRIPGVPTWSWMSLTGSNMCYHEITKRSIEAKLKPMADGQLRMTCRVLTAAEVKRANAFIMFDMDFLLDTAVETVEECDARLEVQDYLMETLPPDNVGSSMLPHGARCYCVAQLYTLVQNNPRGLYVLVICSTGNFRNLLGIAVERVGDNLYRRLGVVEVLRLKRWWRCRSTVVLI
ncbi:hypothetical protein MAPG_00781 [Magnaporthiopsis poae ATCC 64411]|uniref:Heterokaryon incompatibility domain-containing protein n=1 Tax=Magnaporthiopsis poae (strain ATCC 64411 / 73-15) TaxID=644358 RepID=A0A0C4DLY1_MAGP6|nr:hypothetical protein MAPG_00781 [Magnaporthiopsis poae ATCC 64411]